MRNKIHYSEVFKAVEKAVETDTVQLQCGECGLGFYKIVWVGLDEPDYIEEEGQTYKCSDHLLYDLLVNPEVTQSIMITQVRKVQVHVKRIDAQLFIPNRYN